jgi:hypothetical protein
MALCWFLISLTAVLLGPQAAWANACVKAFDSHPPIVSLFENEWQNSLSPAIQQRLMDHPLFDLSRNKMKSGDSIYFYFANGFEKENWEIRRSEKGEGLQALAIKKYLEFLFPQARFGIRPLPDELHNFKQIKLSFRDSAEMSFGLPINMYYHTLEMTRLKAGNPGNLSGVRDRIRTKLNIPHDLKIVSVYVADTSVLEFGRLTWILEQLKPDFDVIMFSSGMHLFPSIIERLPKHLQREKASPQITKNFRLLSSIDFAKDDLKDLLLFNDTVGLMPYVHALADLSVVVGPCNFFESLNVGTKTISLQAPGTSRNYNPLALDEMSEVARQSGGFTVAYTWTDFKHWRQELADLNTPVAPAFVGGRGSAFQKVLDDLLRVIGSQVKE